MVQIAHEGLALPLRRAREPKRIVVVLNVVDGAPVVATNDVAGHEVRHDPMSKVATNGIDVAEKTRKRSARLHPQGRCDVHTFHPFGYVTLHVHEYIEVVRATEILFRKTFYDSTDMLRQIPRTKTFVCLYPLVKIIKDHHTTCCTGQYQKKRRQMTERRSVILLDLDHTLVHTTMDVQYPNYDVIPHDTLHIHIRPYVREFLQHLMATSHLYEFGFWTCGTHKYARHVVSGLLEYVNVPDWPVRILLTRNDAVYLNGNYIKDLHLVKSRFGITNVLLLDDSSVHLTLPTNVPNICLVPAFRADDPHSFRDRFLLNLTHMPRAPSPPTVYRPRPVRPTSITPAPVLW